jgi:bromodomain and WD repeat domain-containing protein 1/3
MCFSVWCLLTGATLAVYRTHHAMVTLVAFLPYISGDDRYLLSAGNDCVINFYKWSAMNRNFEWASSFAFRELPFYRFSQQPTRFHERVNISGCILSSCHSPGGNLIVAGDTHNYIHIYRISSDAGVVKLEDIAAHGVRTLHLMRFMIRYLCFKDHIDSLVWAHSGLRFASGSRDGLAKVWTLRRGRWVAKTLDTHLRTNW